MSKDLTLEILEHIRVHCRADVSLTVSDFLELGDVATVRENLTVCKGLGWIVAEGKVVSLMDGDIDSFTVPGLTSRGFEQLRIANRSR